MSWPLWQQWEANIHHLKAQLALSEALLQTKNATIDVLNILNYRLKEIISTNRRMEIIDDTAKDEEPTGNSVFAIKKYDGRWFSIDLPEIIRRLKEQFG